MVHEDGVEGGGECQRTQECVRDVERTRHKPERLADLTADTEDRRGQDPQEPVRVTTLTPYSADRDGEPIHP